MAYDAKVLEVFIASPGDVKTERDIASEVIFKWNELHSKQYGIVLLPIKWETHFRTAYSQNHDTQGELNEQILNDTDILIGIFWTKIGHKTKNFDSGTIEEIATSIKQGKSIKLYFSDKPIPRQGLDFDQFQKVEDFKDTYKNQGLYQVYIDEQDFRQKLYEDLVKEIDVLKKKLNNQVV
nr:hypothetical protein [Neobacillus sp. Marseille-Q6967]